MNITIGTDIEFFLLNIHKNELISPENLRNQGFIGSKEHPKEYGSTLLSQDGFSVEFAIPPCSNVEDWKFHINQNKKLLENFYYKSLKIVEKPFLEIPPDIFFTSSIETQMFGCSAEYNVYSKDYSIIQNKMDVQSTLNRSAGGHIHISTGESDMSETEICEERELLIKNLDNVILPIEQHFSEFNKERYQLYGSPGSCRLKKYGVEWRSPSNSWAYKDDTIRWMFNIVKEITYQTKKYKKVFEVTEGKDQSQMMRHLQFQDLPII